MNVLGEAGEAWRHWLLFLAMIDRNKHTSMCHNCTFLKQLSAPNLKCLDPDTDGTVTRQHSHTALTSFGAFYLCHYGSLVGCPGHLSSIGET
jgi:hypothetical protein